MHDFQDGRVGDAAFKDDLAVAGEGAELAITLMPGKRIQFDDETWHALERLRRDRMQDFRELADEAFRDLLRKHGRPTDLKAALRQSVGESATIHKLPSGRKRKDSSWRCGERTAAPISISARSGTSKRSTTFMRFSVFPGRRRKTRSVARTVGSCGSCTPIAVVAPTPIRGAFGW